MRKKSHITLSKFLLGANDDFLKHRKSFYLGSILPDCVPSFITKRHCIDDTFDILKKEINNITEDLDITKGVNSQVCRKLGVITHYVADYFTFPHNKNFLGNLKDHCVYENDLKISLRNYVLSAEAKKVKLTKKAFNNVNQLIEFIEDMHSKYMQAIKEVKVDCSYIVEICHRVVDALLVFIRSKLNVPSFIPFGNKATLKHVG